MVDALEGLYLHVAKMKPFSQTQIDGMKQGFHNSERLIHAPRCRKVPAAFPPMPMT